MSGRAGRSRLVATPRARRAGVASDGADVATRERLLEAGRRLFVARGFHRVTVREITDEARANLAAVSYHFGDKLGLYLEVVQGAIAAAGAAFESTRSPAGAPAAERLRHYVQASLQRMADFHERKAWIHQLMSHEVMSPTPALPFIIEQAMRPRLDYLAGIVSELLGCDRSDPRVGLCVASIHAQFLFHLRSPVRDIAFAEWGMAGMSAERVASHIVDFSLGGITGARRPSPRG